MEHAQLEVSWLHPSEGISLYKTLHYTLHLMVSINYTTLGGLYTLHNTLHLVVSMHYTIHYTWWSLYTTQYTTLGGLFLLCVWCCHVLGIHSG